MGVKLTFWDGTRTITLETISGRSLVISDLNWIQGTEAPLRKLRWSTVTVKVMEKRRFILHLGQVQEVTPMRKATRSLQARAIMPTCWAKKMDPNMAIAVFLQQKLLSQALGNNTIKHSMVETNR